MSQTNANVPISAWTFEEEIKANEVPSKGFQAKELHVPLFLPERRIYCYLEAAVSASPGAFVLLGELLLLNRGSLVGSLPVNLADFTGGNPSQSVARLFNSGGSPVGDSVVVTLAQPFNAAVTNVTVQPLRINAQIDHIIFRVSGVVAGVMTGWRVWYGCLSTAF